VATQAPACVYCPDGDDRPPTHNLLIRLLQQQQQQGDTTVKNTRDNQRSLCMRIIDATQIFEKRPSRIPTEPSRPRRTTVALLSYMQFIKEASRCFPWGLKQDDGMIDNAMSWDRLTSGLMLCNVIDVTLCFSDALHIIIMLNTFINLH